MKIRPGCFLLNTEEKPGGYVPGVCPGLFMADSSKKNSRVFISGVVLGTDNEYNIINGGGELKITEFLGLKVIRLRFQRLFFRLISLFA